MQSTRGDQTTNDVKPSMTALSVAMAFMRSLDTEYEYLFTKQELELIKHICYVGKQSLVGMNWALGEGISALPYSMQQSFFNFVVLPGYDQIIMLRKLMVKNKIENAIKNGTKQIVFLGGGYDIRAFIISLTYPEVSIYELDRGPTRESKLKGLKTIPKTMGFDGINIQELSTSSVIVNKNLYYIACDLSKDSLSEKLYEHGFSKENKTLIIAEGLTMYLSKDENQNLLLSLSKILDDESELLLSYGSEIPHSKIAETSLKSSNEFYRFSLHPQKVISFVEGCGFSINAKFDVTTMLEKIGDSSASIYQKNDQNRPKEWYYSLQKLPSLKDNMTIDDIPSIDLEIPNKPVKEKSRSYCSLL